MVKGEKLEGSENEPDLKLALNKFTPVYLVPRASLNTAIMTFTRYQSMKMIRALCLFSLSIHSLLYSLLINSL